MQHAMFWIRRYLIVAAVLLGVTYAGVARGQDAPLIVAAPDAGDAGSFITLRGINFDPGNYEGRIFWDGVPVGALKIPDGGDFSTSFRLPPAADPGIHVIRVCAALRNDETGELECFAGEFEQVAETKVEVLKALPIRLCKEFVEDCASFSSATVLDPDSGRATTLDGNGYVVDRELFRAGDRIWAYSPNTTAPQYTVNFTSGAPLPVDELYFDPQTLELRLALSLDAPLLLYDLTASAEWSAVSEAVGVQVRANLEKTSQYLYDFTEGQIALRTITVNQGLDEWEGADIHLYSSNTLRPNAVVGGIVSTYTTDIDPVVDITYEPGVVSIGAQWNRYGVPPGQPITHDGVVIDTATLGDDWPMALAHELGHYLLFLFDTYRDAEGNDSADIAAQCVGSAMSDVYRPENHAFIGGARAWAARCGTTEAYAKQQGRTEWDTIIGRYTSLIKPAAPPQPDEQPAGLTTVIYVAPGQPAPTPLAADLFALNYQDGESSSGEARAFLYRNNRIFDQGKPIKDANQITLTGAQLDDRLCVYDVNDYSEDAGDAPRHQFGCEIIQAGDTTLEMTKNVAWRPIITLQQIGADTLRISVTQDLPGEITGLVVQAYPEHQPALPPVQIPADGTGTLTHDLVLPGPVPPLYLQLYLDEAVAGVTTRRETVVDRGTGGGGLFGPIKKFSGVFVYSSDGEASFSKDGTVELLAGESIAWQTMAGTPAVPADKQIAGQAYRLDAYPPSLVDEGTVAIEFDELAAVGAATIGAGDPALHYFDGVAWQALPTTIVTPDGRADGVRVATADSAGVGIYAVMYDEQVQQIWLPFVIVR